MGFGFYDPLQASSAEIGARRIVVFGSGYKANKANGRSDAE